MDTGFRVIRWLYLIQALSSLARIEVASVDQRVSYSLLINMTQPVLGGHR